MCPQYIGRGSSRLSTCEATRTTVIKTPKDQKMAEDTRDRPLLDLVAKMTTDSLETSTLDPDKLMVARLAALVAVDAPPASYLVNLAAARDIGIDPEEVRGVLAGIMPIVGTTRVVASAGNIARALSVAIRLTEEDQEAQPAAS
jgi:hypothetical protein